MQQKIACYVQRIMITARGSAKEGLSGEGNFFIPFSFVPLDEKGKLHKYFMVTMNQQVGFAHEN